MSRRPSRRTLAVSVGAAAATVLVAHPVAAHSGLPAGGAGDGLTHPLVGVDHLLAMVAVGVLAAIAKDRRIAWLTPVGFLAGMVAGGLLGFGGVDAPFVELAIAASVVGLGGLIVARTETSSLWLPLAAVVIGALHGQAHGAELPGGATPLAYMAGFVVATAGLHLAGTGIGLGLRRAPAARVAAGALVATAGALLVTGA
ncbi:urease accessory protein [Iamia sp. SCSIO 61187]|uniref:HupE/UreJ family protein n=1 Tax=Iamia sp. SCSIO 61187 TaxID=2722752 RepID=UPI001C634ACE|nr:HupE/UreJ family protein [Iamia sp. SCSIO 61187]QYG94717.1 urease accessory protein [Iamia sp. SCSIO 61187]